MEFISSHKLTRNCDVIKKEKKNKKKKENDYWTNKLGNILGVIQWKSEARNMFLLVLILFTLKTYKIF